MDDDPDVQVIAVSHQDHASSSSDVDPDADIYARKRDPNWKADEHLYNPQYKDGYSPLYVPPSIQHDTLDKAANQATLSGEAISYVNSMYETFKRESRNPIACVQPVVGVSIEDLEKLDETEIASKFSIAASKLIHCVKYIAADDALDRVTAVRVCSIAHNLVTKVKKLENLAIFHISLCREALAETEIDPMSEDALVWLQMPVQIEDPNVLQQFYVYAMKQIIRYGYGRYADNLMRRIVTQNGLLTNAWVKQCSISDFVKDLTSHADACVLKWSTTSAGILEQVVKLLCQNRESWIPWIKPDRHAFAFRNGCYIANKEMFVPFVAGVASKMPDGNGGTCELPTACKFHDYDVNPAWLTLPDPYDIPTPISDMLMDTQMLSQGVKRCYYAMLGRAQYDIGECDNWQVVLYVKGQAGTGKSSLLEFVQSWYNTEDVATLSNNIEATFGASMLVGKFVVVGDDLGENFSLDQMLFQKMISGNDVSLPKKNTNSVNVKWKIPLLLSGNVIPDYTDNGGGSYARRMFIVSYTHAVISQDTEIPNKLAQETAAAIIKCNRLYRNMVRRLKADSEKKIGFWESVPEDFKLEKLNVMQSSNPLIHFLNSGKIVIPNLPKAQTYMPLSQFREAFMAHCQENNFKKPRWNKLTYEGPFTAMNIVVDRVARRRKYPRPNGPELAETWILGCDLASTNTLSLAQRAVASISNQPEKRAAPTGPRDTSAEPPKNKPAPSF